MSRPNILFVGWMSLILAVPALLITPGLTFAALWLPTTTLCLVISAASFALYIKHTYNWSIRPTVLAFFGILIGYFLLSILLLWFVFAINMSQF